MQTLKPNSPWIQFNLDEWIAEPPRWMHTSTFYYINTKKAMEYHVKLIFEYQR